MVVPEAGLLEGLPRPASSGLRLGELAPNHGEHVSSEARLHAEDAAEGGQHAHARDADLREHDGCHDHGLSEAYLVQALGAGEQPQHVPRDGLVLFAVDRFRR